MQYANVHNIFNALHKMYYISPLRNGILSCLECPFGNIFNKRYTWEQHQKHGITRVYYYFVENGLQSTQNIRECSLLLSTNDYLELLHSFWYDDLKHAKRSLCGAVCDYFFFFYFSIFVIYVTHFEEMCAPKCINILHTLYWMAAFWFGVNFSITN